MYILVRESVPRGLGINAVGHVALSTYLKFKDHPDTEEWLRESYRQVTCLVSDKEFESAKKAKEFDIFYENDYNDEPVAMGFRPRREWPRVFKYLKLFR